VRKGYDARTILQVVNRAQQGRNTWLERLAPEDVPQPLGMGIYPIAPRAHEGRQSDIVLNKVYLLAQQGELPVIRIGKNVRMKVSDLEKWLERQKVEV
jgi:excisionase family DNA binding protein